MGRLCCASGGWARKVWEGEGAGGGRPDVDRLFQVDVGSGCANQLGRQASN